MVVTIFVEMASRKHRVLAGVFISAETKVRKDVQQNLQWEVLKLQTHGVLSNEMARVIEGRRAVARQTWRGRNMTVSALLRSRSMAWFIDQDRRFGPLTAAVEPLILIGVNPSHPHAQTIGRRTTNTNGFIPC